MKQGASGSEKHDPKRNAAQLCDEFIQAWGSAGYDAYKMDRDQRLGAHWPSVKDKHTKLLQREPKTHAQRGPASS
eukprot:6831105-Pyramimonas_sp.AAC.1